MRRKSVLVSAGFILAIFIIIVILTFIRVSSTKHSDLNHHSPLNNSSTATRPRPGNRKLQVFGTCTNRDISISQSRDLTSGIPRYIVQIVNTCVSGCAPSHIHLHCGWFASAKLVNPTTFKRVSYDDCFVNAGKPLMTGQIIRFTYLNSDNLTHSPSSPPDFADPSQSKPRNSKP